MAVVEPSRTNVCGPSSPAWRQLTVLCSETLPSISALCAQPERGSHFTASGAGLVLDYSRQRVTDAVMSALLLLADQVDLRGRISAMYRGDIANPTEGRQVLHTALRRGDAPHAAEVGAFERPADGLIVVVATAEEEAAHQEFMRAIGKASGGKALWQ